MDYMPRIADALLEGKLSSKGAVLVEGAKWCGKTTTALQHVGSVLYMQDPDNTGQNLEMAQLRPSRLLQGKTPRLIDEWQMAENLWDAVRFEVDKRGKRGQFVLTGSAVPPDLDKISHTGTGRIARITMRPMTLFESGESDGSVSLGALFAGADDVEGHSERGVEDVAYCCCRGGWPGALGLQEGIALEQAVEYHESIVTSDISRVDSVSRSEERARGLLRAYARATGSQTSLASIRGDMLANDSQALSKDTVSSYAAALRKIFVLEDSPAWNPNLRSRTAIRTSATRYFTDPSIATAALGAGPEDLLDDLRTMGLVFENLCVRDLRVYAQALGGRVYHYRDRNGLECDAVLHRRDGSFGLVEVKLGGKEAVEEGAATLRKLAGNLDRPRMREPSFLLVVTATGGYAYRREDGVFTAPVTCLGP